MYFNSILKTINGGYSWVLVSIGQTIEVNDLYFTSADTGYLACSNSKILKTTDGGINWNVFTFGTSDVFKPIEFTSDNIGYAAGASGTIATTINAGTTWAPSSSGITQHNFCADFPSSQIGYIGTQGSPGKIFKTTNRGGILSIFELIENKSISIFPNPAADIITLNMNNTNKADLTLTIYNIVDSVVKTEILKSKSATNLCGRFRQWNLFD